MTTNILIDIRDQDEKLIVMLLASLRSRRFRFRQNIYFGTSATYAPYEFVDADNKIVGFAIDVANAVCKDASGVLIHQPALIVRSPCLRFKKV